jgi:ATP-dependent Zn protease
MQAWWSALFSWIPFIVLIVFWIYFMKRMKASRHPELVARTFQHMERVEALLERIAIAVEKRD